MLRAFSAAFIVAVVVAAFSAPASATPQYSQTSHQGCSVCHVSPRGGGELTHRGLEYAASGYVWPPEGGYRVLGPIRRPVRLVIGFLHILAAFIWFGTILYVHILLRPAYAEKGLPRGEVFIGLVSMAVIGVTGVLLTVSRIKGVEVLWQSRWGIILLLKVALYLVLVSSAAVVVTVIGPRLRRRMREAAHPRDGVFCPATIEPFDGRDGRPAYVAYEGRVFDVTDSALWRGGEHMARHRAGRDMTAELKKAPHGPEMLEKAKLIGAYDRTRTAPKTPAQRAFHVLAYWNLAVVFAVLFVISLWRWG